MKTKAKVVKLSEILKDNPIMCLSAFRQFTLCHKCQKFINAFRYNRENKLKCNPQLNPKIIELLEEKRKVLREYWISLDQIREKIKKLE